MRMQSLFLLLLVVSGYYGFAGGNGSQSYSVRVGISYDADQLKPATSTSAVASNIQRHLYQSLTNIDPVSHRMMPILADTLAVWTYNALTQTTQYTYHIRKDAKWDNGQPITARDVAWSVKVVKCQLIAGNSGYSYYDYIIDVKTDAMDPYFVTFVCKGKNILHESLCGELAILPEYYYDPAGALDTISITEMNKGKEVQSKHAGIVAFAKTYNTDDHDVKQVIGSGPYELAEWTSGQRIVLVHKKNWWGDGIRSNYFCEAYPDTIAYILIAEEQSRYDALKEGKIDVMDAFSYPLYQKEIKGSKEFEKMGRLYMPPTLSYSYLGINMKSPKLRDVKTRQAIAHLVDAEKIHRDIYIGTGVRIHGPLIADTQSDSTLNPYEYSPSKAASLLKEAGWKDKNGDGVLEKKIDGKKVDLTIEYAYNAGNNTRREIGLMLQADAAKVGIKVEVKPVEWAAYIQNLNQHKFEMCFGAWVTGGNPWDPMQLWHTESQTGGSNYCGFGDEESDKLVEAIRTEMNQDKRNELGKKLALMINEQVPYVFLFRMPGKIVVSKRIAEIDAFGQYPCFNPATFKLAK